MIPFLYEILLSCLELFSLLRLTVSSWTLLRHVFVPFSRSLNIFIIAILKFSFCASAKWLFSGLLTVDLQSSEGHTLVVVHSRNFYAGI